MVENIISGESLNVGAVREPEDNTGEEMRTISFEWFDL